METTMDPELLAALRTDVARASDSPAGSSERLVRACLDATEVTGAGIMLMIDGEHRGTLGATDDAITIVEELQFTLGEGPCIDTYTSGEPVLEPHLREPDEVRWHEFSGPALAAGVEAIFGFPLIVGDVRLGALDLYVDQPWVLTAEQHADAVVMADVVVDAILSLQSRANPGALAVELETGARLRSVVHQASGMLAVQLDISVTDALARLRAHAYSEDQPINDLARAIVGRELRLE
jgi:hypothetical protein